MSEASERIDSIVQRIAQAAKSAGRSPADVTLLAATKTRDTDTVREIIANGISVVGENRVQEMTQKLAENAYENASLHFIGQLQSNKVRQVAGYVDLIHSVDSLKLAQEINKAVVARSDMTQPQDILIEINIGGETSKGGIQPGQLKQFLYSLSELPAIRISGLMCIPPPAQTKDEARRYFAQMKELFDRHCDSFSLHRPPVLSMGMSDDFEQAILEGSTLVRVGTALFGPRH